MSEPLRFRPANPAHEMVFCPDGNWVAYGDYQQLKAELINITGWGRGLEQDLSWARAHLLIEKTEVERLKAEPDALTAYLYADTLRRDDIKTLKAQIERLTKAGDEMASRLMDGGVILPGHLLAEDWFKSKWNAAKEGKQP